MKKVCFILLLLSFSLGYVCAQVPQAFKYQAIVRNPNNNNLVIANQVVSLRISILQGSASDTVKYSETFSVTSNEFGLVNLEIGRGAPVSGTFSAIDWSMGSYYLKTEVDPAGGTAYQSMGIIQLMSVPYALYSSKTNTNAKFTINGTDQLNPDTALFEVKDRLGRPVFAVYEDGAIVYVNEGAKGGRGGFAVGGRRPMKGDYQYEDIMRVTSDSVRIYINDTAVHKGGRGGFAVGGRKPSKGTVNDYLQVTPDSTRIYINDITGVKGGRGGFTVGGRKLAKGIMVNDYLRVTPDSTRVYVNEPIGKGGRGGFAVGGRGMAKGDTLHEYMNISTSKSASILNPSQARILWYPKKEAFLTGRVLVESPDSVGTNSMATGFESKSKGNYSQALGYQAIARGTYSTSIGYQSLANDSGSFAFGQWAMAKSQESYAFGRGAIAEGFRSFSFGSAGVDSAGKTTGVAYAKGDYSFAIGQGSQSIGSGSFTIGIADTSKADFSGTFGYQCVANGYGSIALGHNTTANGQYSFTSGAYNTANGEGSVSLGEGTYAGWLGFASGLGSKAAGMSSVAMGYNTISSGDCSVALGFYTRAPSRYSTALGESTIASGESSTAMGSSSYASQKYSTAMGYNTNAQGMASTSMGYQTKASGKFSTSMGYGSVASGYSSTGMGTSTLAAGSYSTSMGYSTRSSGFYSTAMGYNTNANLYCSLALGQYNDTTGVYNNYWYGNDPVFIIGNGANAYLLSNAFVVLKNGNVGIGIPNSNAKFNPKAPLDIFQDYNLTYPNSGKSNLGNIHLIAYRNGYSNAITFSSSSKTDAQAGIYVQNDTTHGTTMHFATTDNYVTGPQVRLTISNSGNVGIGTTSPGYKLTVNGTTWCTSGAWSGSDLRWKKNIRTLNNALSEILALRGVRFDWRKEEFPDLGFENIEQIGLIAQEVEKVFPELVRTDNKGYKAVAYDKLGAVLVEAIKDQQKQIENQKMEIDELKTLVNSLMANQTIQGNK